MGRTSANSAMTSLLRLAVWSSQRRMLLYLRCNVSHTRVCSAWTCSSRWQHMPATLSSPSSGHLQITQPHYYITIYWHCPHRMQSRVYAMVRCLSVCLSQHGWRSAVAACSGQCHTVSMRRKQNVDIFFIFSSVDLQATGVSWKVLAYLVSVNWFYKSRQP